MLGASALTFQDVFELEELCSQFKQDLTLLCSSNLDAKDLQKITGKLSNFNLAGLTEKDCFDALNQILPDCPSKNVAKVLKLAPTFLSPHHVEKLVSKCSASIKTADKNAFLEIVSSSNLVDRLESDVSTAVEGSQNLSVLLGFLCTGSKNPQLVERVLAICASTFTHVANKNFIAKFFQDLAFVCSTNEVVRSQVESYVKDAQFIMEFEILALIFVFKDVKHQELWKSVLAKADQGFAKIVISVGSLLTRIDSGNAHQFKLFALNFIEENPYHEQLSLFLSFLLMSCRSFSRAEMISELLMLASESEDKKYIQYLNTLLDIPSDAVSLSINDFKTVLDFVEFVPPTMILDFYTVMVKIALKMATGANCQVMNELCLIIRKQLASANEHICLNGVAGALALATSSIPNNQEAFDFEFASCSQSAAKSKTGLSADSSLAKEFLLMAYTSSLRFASVSAFFFDKTIKFASEDILSAELMELLNEKLASDFQNNFVSDSAEDVPEDGEIKLNLMEDSELVVIRIFPVITDTAMSNAMIQIPKHLRLLGLLEKKLNGNNLENIDAILKFPMVLPARNVDAQLCFISYLLACNMIREMINIFQDQSDVVVKENCRKRLLHVSEIEGDLLELMRHVNSFSGFKQTLNGIQVSLSSVKAMQSSSNVITTMANDLVHKASAYCNDKMRHTEEARSTFKVKNENDLYRLCIPIELPVLEWTHYDIDVDGKGKHDDCLTDDQFLVLLYEIKMQIATRTVESSKLISSINGALDTFLSCRNSIDDESDLKNQFAKLITEIAAELKSHGLLSSQLIRKLRQVFEDEDEDKGKKEADLDQVKLKILLMESPNDEKEILKMLISCLDTASDLSAISDVISKTKLFSTGNQILFNSVYRKYCQSYKSVHLQRSLFEMLLVEIERSQSLESDQWIMQQLENLAQAAKNQYTIEGAETSLKYSRDAVNSIVGKVMPRLEAMLLDQKDEVLAVLKKFQQFTRTVQTLCNHIKSVKEKPLLKRIPPLKKSLETSLLRVKQLLQANNCHGAFWVGNLKHKGLDGKEVASQIPLKRDDVDSDVDEGEEEEEDEDEVMESVEDESQCEDPTLVLSL